MAIGLATLYFVRYSPVFRSPGITDSVFVAVVETELDVSFIELVRLVTEPATASFSGRYGV